MYTFRDMCLNQELNQSVTDGRTDVGTYGWTDKGNTICPGHIRGRDIKTLYVNVRLKSEHFDFFLNKS